MTTMYGVLTRNEYAFRFQDYIMKKYGLKNYAEYQQWTAKNSELLGNEYDEFQNITGLKGMRIADED